MNERIQELAEQAEEYASEKINNGAAYDEFPLFYTEKLVELIVEECIHYCGENLCETVGGALRVHLGVEK